MSGRPLKPWFRSAGELLLAAALPAVCAAALAGEFRPRVEVVGPGPAAVANSLSVPEALGAAGQGALWLDARPADAFARGHAPGALPLTEDHWGDQLGGVLERWEPTTRIIVYCDGGDCRASEQVAARLRDAGIDGPVFILRGGWAELEAALKAEAPRGKQAGQG